MILWFYLIYITYLFLIIHISPKKTHAKVVKVNTNINRSPCVVILPNIFEKIDDYCDIIQKLESKNVYTDFVEWKHGANLDIDELYEDISVQKYDYVISRGFGSVLARHHQLRQNVRKIICIEPSGFRDFSYKEKMISNVCHVIYIFTHIPIFRTLSYYPKYKYIHINNNNENIFYITKHKKQYSSIENVIEYSHRCNANDIACRMILYSHFQQ
jgi:hypothetical protein